MSDTEKREIERYIHDQMNESERLLFEKKMDENPGLKEDIILGINLQKALNENYDATKFNQNNKKLIEDLRKELSSKEIKTASDFIKKSTRDFKKKKKKTSFQLIYKFTATVAAIVLVVFLLKATLQSNSSDYYEQYANWNDLPSLVEKGLEKDKLTKIEQAFDAEKYTDVVTLVGDSKDSYQLIYKGVSFIKLNDFKNATQTFNVLSSNNSLESSRGYWYNFLIYLKQNDKQKAKNMLHKILENKDNYNYKVALELVDELK